MKCPKCNYLGFETGDRCRNCGYDFSLLSAAENDVADYEIHPAAVDDLPIQFVDRHLQDLPISLASDASFEEVSLTPESLPDDTPDLVEVPLAAPVTPFTRTGASATSEVLPLFTPAGHDDEPLIKLPPAPRPPLAVRRTPETPRLRAVPRAGSRPSPAPVLQFSEENVERPAPPSEEPRIAPSDPVQSGNATSPIRPMARITAVAIDYLILLGIDCAVLYFTLRMAGLAMGEWRLLPLPPLLAFLGLLKLAYFYAFTAVGGQTIGKMAVGTCVVADNGSPVDAARAMRRTSAGVVSLLLLGAGFLPALFGDHRALHDRLAGTRVVRLRPA